MMEDRFRRLEDFSEISLELHRMAEANRQRMLENQRQAEERQRQAEERQRQAEERQRQAEERLRQIEGEGQQLQELLSRLAQTVALMQADIVRLDETR